MSRFIILLTALAVAVVAAAQTPAKPPAAPAAAALLKAELEPRGFTYAPDGRRDPFISLMQRGSDTETSAPAVRAPGLAGLGAGEVTLKGTMASSGGYVAILQGADTKTYVVRPGERLMDGTVRAITPDTLVILQRVNDPLAHEKLREVRKTLRLTEEAK